MYCERLLGERSGEPVVEDSTDGAGAQMQTGTIGLTRCRTPRRSPGRRLRGGGWGRAKAGEIVLHRTRHAKARFPKEEVFCLLLRAAGEQELSWGRTDAPVTGVS